MKALILAAGLGNRLGELTKDIPKCMLPVFGNETLVDFSLQAISDSGFEEVIFITGFANSVLEKHINNKWSNKFSIKYIFNEKYSEFNNVYSAYLATDIWDDNTVLFNSDIIYHPDILKNLVLKIKSNVIARSVSDEAISQAESDCHASFHSARNDISQKSYLVIHDNKILNEEDMKVQVNEKLEIKMINKKLDIKTSHGEYIGITYLCGKPRELFLKSLKDNIDNGKTSVYYEDALGDVLESISVLPSSTNALQWTEVDTKEDYEIAKKIANDLKVLV